jgi:hypothetical protein
MTSSWSVPGSPHARFEVSSHASNAAQDRIVTTSRWCIRRLACKTCSSRCSGDFEPLAASRPRHPRRIRGPVAVRTTTCRSDGARHHDDAASASVRIKFYLVLAERTVTASPNTTQTSSHPFPHLGMAGTRCKTARGSMGKSPVGRESRPYRRTPRRKAARSLMPSSTTTAVQLGASSSM